MTALARLFADNILPIVVIAGAGFALQRSLDIDPRSISRVAFYVSTPALVFSLLVATQIQVTDIVRMMGLAALVITAVGLLSWGLARLVGLSAGMVAAFVLASTFMNSGNYGLSVNQFAFGDQGLAWASIFYITATMLTNSAGVYIATVGHTSPAQALLGLAKVPSVYAIPLALLVRAWGHPLPLPLWRPIQLLGASAVPLMLLLLGMQLSRSGLPRRKRLLAASAVLRLVISPALAWLLVGPLGLHAVARQAGILEAGMPTAVFNTIIAVEFGVEPEFVTGAVLASTLLSPITVTPLIAALGG